MLGNAAVFVLVWVTTLVLPSSGIKCLDCNSRNNSMCIDPKEYDVETVVRNIPIIECGQGVYGHRSGQYFCRKIVQTIFHKGYEPDVRVTRSCGWEQHRLPCYKADNEDHLETVCQCFTDQCNGAPSCSSGFLALAVMGIVAYWL